jgi:hypothetical protein
MGRRAILEGYPKDPEPMVTAAQFTFPPDKTKDD